MVSHAEKERMTRFIAERLEEAGLYSIVTRDTSHLLVTQRPDQVEHPRSVYVVAHNYRRTVDEAKKLQQANRERRVHTAHVFYKDGESFMVRLGRRGLLKSSRSLGNYSKPEIDAMIHLRDLEKAVLKQYSTHSPQLVYYQPAGDKLPQGLRLFRMADVILTYNHLTPDDPAAHFAENGRSIDYKLPISVGYVASGPIYLLLDNAPACRAVFTAQHDGVVSPPAPKPALKAGQLSLF